MRFVDEGSQIREGQHLKIQIVIAGKTYEVEADVEGEKDLSAGPAPVQSVLLPTAPRRSSSTGGDVDEAKVCRSPVAGIVTRVCVQPGQESQVDDLIVVLEAMKMETSVIAPIAGQVKSVKVGPGEAVKLRQILMEFE
jgi:methylmalonyl-CoA carboxyltransferase small subunit